MTNDENTCNSIIPQARELLSPYMDDAVTPAERALVEDALAQSAELRAELDDLRHTVQMMQALPRVPAPRPFTLSAADAGIVPPKKPRFFGKSLWAGLSAIAALAVVVVVGVTIFQQSFGGEQNGTQVALAPAAEMSQAAVAPTEAPPEAAFSAAEAPETADGATLEAEMAAPTAPPAADASIAEKEPAPVEPLEKSAPQPMAQSAALTESAAEAGAAPAAEPPLACDVPPAEAFLAVWQDNPALQSALGCPIDPNPRMNPAAWDEKTSFQPFEHGAMIWSDHVAWYPQPIIYVLLEDGTYHRFDDTFNPETDAATGDELPPDGLLAPVLGFGKVWRMNSAMRDALGWATAPEQSGTGKFQMFEGGEMLSLSQNGKIYAFLSDTGQVEIFGGE